MLTAEKIQKCPLHDTQTGIWYLGQVGFLLKSGNSHIAVDPYLSDYVDRNCSQTVSWKRLYPPPIDAGDLNFLDAVLCTHAHYDHTDPDTLTKIRNSRTKFLIPAPEVSALTAIGIPETRIVPAKAWQNICVGEFEIIPVPAAHEQLHTDGFGNYKELGYLIRTQGKTFFHAGDMCMYEGLVDSLLPYPIDVAFLPINGRDYFRNRQDIIGNFTCEEAVLLAKDLGVKLLIPMHHDLYAVNRVRISRFTDAVEELDPYRPYHIFAPGELYIKE